MNILFIYELENEELQNITFKIEEKIKILIKNKTINILRKNKINQRVKADIYVILSDNYEEVDIYFEKIKDKNKSIVLTSNISSSNILNLIKNTKNVCYTKNDVDVLANKIYNVYLESIENHV